MKNLIILGLFALAACGGPVQDSNHRAAEVMNDPGPDGAVARAKGLDMVQTDYKASAPVMFVKCINGTYYIVNDGYYTTVSLAPLYENGADHPTGCKGGLVLQHDDQAEVAAKH